MSVFLSSFFRCILMITVLFSLNIFAQSESTNNPLDASYFAQSLTENIYNDTIKIPNTESAIILAEIGDQWFKLNPAKASIWFERAITSVNTLSSDTPEEISKKNQIIRELAKIILPKDKKNGNRLLKYLTNQSESNNKEVKQNNDALIEAAISLIKTDPDRAVALASLALNSDNPVFEPYFIWTLNKANPSLADIFFTKTLQIAQKNNDLRFTNILISAVFPEVFGVTGSNLANTNKLKLLRYVWFDFQQKTQQMIQNKSGDCRTHASIVFSILPKFSEFMPENLPEIKNRIDFCQRNANEEIKNYYNDEEKPKTVEEFISAAENAEDKNLKREYYISGAKLAFKEKNYELAIKVLDLAKESLPDNLISLWEEWRHNWAAHLIVQQIKDNNQPEAIQTLKNVPDKLKPLTQIDVVQLFKPQEHSEIAFSFLSDAAKTILKLDMDTAEKAYNLSQIAKLFAQYQMLESSIDAYRNSVKLINYAVNERDEKNTNKKIDSGSELVGFVDFTTFPDNFVEANLLSFRELTNNIDSPLLRAKTKLNLLTVAVNKLKQELKDKNNTKKTVKINL